MGGDIGEIQLGSGRELYKYINHLSVVTKVSSKIILLIVQVCVCVCVFFPFILDIKFVGRTTRGHTGGRSHRIFHPPFCGACLNFTLHLHFRITVVRS